MSGLRQNPRDDNRGVQSGPSEIVNLKGDHVVQRIQPVDEQSVSPIVQQAFADAARRGAPNPTLLRILARHPVALNAFYAGWQSTFYDGIVEHTLKELMRVRMARLRNCGY